MELFGEFDANNDDQLSRDEFEKLIGNAPRLKDNPKAADFLFTRLDENKDGSLSADEMAIPLLVDPA